MFTILIVFLSINSIQSDKVSANKNYTTSNSSFVSPCQKSNEFAYYHIFENDHSKYIQCDPWGTYEIKSCDKNQHWNSWEFKCTPANQIKNLTLISTPSLLLNNSIDFDCNSTEPVCLNEGVCSEKNGKFKCICKTNFTGQFCEKSIEIVDLYHDILDKKFSIDSYKSRMMDEDLTNNITYYEKYRDVLNNETYDELMNYLSYFDETDRYIRYDTLMNTLVQDIMREIYPDIEFLVTFNASENNMIEMVTLIHDLLSYAKYYNNAYIKAFKEYEKVLNSLVQILNKTSTEKLFNYKREAKSYARLTLLFLNQTSSILNNQTISNTSEEYFKLYTQNELFPILSMPKSFDVIEYLKFKFNSTLINIKKSHDLFYPLQVKILNELDKNSLIRNQSLGVMANEWLELRNLIMSLDQVSYFASHIWDVLVNYGFWHLTNNLSDLH